MTDLMRDPVRSGLASPILGVGGIVPLAPDDPSTGMTLHAEGDSGITSTAGLVDDFGDFSATATGRPAHNTAAQNGLDTLTSDGDNDTMAGPALSVLLGASGWTAYSVFRLLAVGSNEAVKYRGDPIWGTPSGYLGLHANASPGGDGDSAELALYVYDGTAKYALQTITIGNWVLSTATWSSASGEARLTVDGVDWSSVTAGAVTNQAVAMGLFKSITNHYSNAQKGGISFHNFAHDDTMIARVRAHYERWL